MTTEEIKAMETELLSTHVTPLPAVVPPSISLDEPSLYFNRELSLLKFNYRVLCEALEEGRHPLLERVKFLAIFFNNMDEFTMIRMSGLRRQLGAGVVEAPPARRFAESSWPRAIRRRDLVPIFDQAMACWREDSSPSCDRLASASVSFRVKGKQRRLLRRHFEREMFPVLTPLAFDPGHPFRTHLESEPQPRRCHRGSRWTPQVCSPQDSRVVPKAAAYSSGGACRVGRDARPGFGRDDRLCLDRGRDH